MLTVIETGSKQYLVKAGDKIQIEKLKVNVGDTITFDKVLFQGEGENLTVGKPYITGKTVEAKVIAAGKGKKIHVLKYKNKSKYRRKIGHRQPFVEVEILKV